MANPIYPNNDSFEEICKEIITLHQKKNHDYGNTFGDLFQKLKQKDVRYALAYAVGHLIEKTTRIEQVAFNGNSIKTESIEDSLIDLASYSIMTLQQIRKNQ